MPLRKAFVILILGLVLVISGGLAHASTPGYSLDWWTVDGGGGLASGGSFGLHGSIGQADSGALSGGVFSLQGGFWGDSGYSLYIPLVIR